MCTLIARLGLRWSCFGALIICLLCRHDLHAEDKENREKLSRDMQAAQRSGASQRVHQAKEAMEAFTPQVPDALRDYIAIVFTSAITSTLVEALFSCVPPRLDVANVVIVLVVRGCGAVVADTWPTSRASTAPA